MPKKTGKSTDKVRKVLDTAGRKWRLGRDKRLRKLDQGLLRHVRPDPVPTR